jgi:hypothetical protein
VARERAGHGRGRKPAAAPLAGSRAAAGSTLCALAWLLLLVYLALHLDLYAVSARWLSALAEAIF